MVMMQVHSTLLPASAEGLSRQVTHANCSRHQVLQVCVNWPQRTCSTATSMSAHAQKVDRRAGTARWLCTRIASGRPDGLPRV